VNDLAEMTMAQAKTGIIFATHRIADPRGLEEGL
jgi:hypothetical protein